MNLGYGLYQEQSQRLILTTQMRQAIELLQCTAVELRERLEQQLADNPFAELGTGEPVDSLDTTAARWLTLGAPHSHRRASGLDDDERPSWEHTVSAEETLYDVLDRQLRLSQAPQRVVRVARILAGCLDESGYLREPAESLASWLQVPVSLVEQAVRLLQSCDPPGIAARDLRECLLLQLAEVPEAVRGWVQQLVENHLEDVAAGRMRAIAQALGTDPSEAQRAVDALRRLNPRPGLAYSGARAPWIVPDVVVRRIDGEYVVLTSEAAHPRLRVSEGYRQLLAQSSDPSARRYLARKLQAAEWLVKCLEQRRLTILRVAEAIVELQRNFMERGPAAMQPLTLRQVADRVGLHESTVSRAVRGKYMLTPRGVYEMRYFFSAGLAPVRTSGHAEAPWGTDGPSRSLERPGADVPAATSGHDGQDSDAGLGWGVSAEAAKHAIRCCIQGEDPRQPLSDEQLARRLAELGIRLSRRTVAKYRDELRIPPSARRRRFV